jgi:AcrR family transcriptional regulator
MMSSRSAGAARPQSMPVRRRGPVLERAILEAALDQLSTVGWNGLTMEGVAAGAQTGKAAVYRRWPSKDALVADALEAALPKIEDVPDQGGVREELYFLCRIMRDAMFSKPGFALRSVLHESEGSAAGRFHDLIINKVTQPSARLFEEVVIRGIERGDVRPDAVDDMVFDVVPALMMYRVKVCGSEWNDDEIAAIVDRVMMPLLRHGGA